MTAMLPRARLAAILARLASPFDGERAAAGLIASKMVREAGVTWSDLVATGMCIAERPPRASSAHPLKPRAAWRDMLGTCRRRPELLTRWERRFLASIDGQATLSRKQWAILAKLADRADA